MIKIFQGFIFLGIMKILLVGYWEYLVYEEALSNAFIKLGHEVVPFKIKNYRKSKNFFSDLFRKIQWGFLFGPIINKINTKLLKAVYYNKPDLIFFFKAIPIYTSTIKTIKKKCASIYLVNYNNDNPFSDRKISDRFFLNNVKLVDLNLAYRKSDFQEYYKLGAKKVYLFMSWYLPKYNYPIAEDKNLYKSKPFDVVFAGHYESDKRKDYLEEIIRNNIKLRIFGDSKIWLNVQNTSFFLSKIPRIKHLNLNKYNKIISRSKIALCFFSTRNNDVYTRRCFEIPAAKTLLICQYSEFMSSLYKENEEIVFFRNKRELINKIKYFLENPVERENIAEKGHLRCIKDGHDVFSRTIHLMEFIEKEKNKPLSQNLLNLKKY